MTRVETAPTPDTDWPAAWPDLRCVPHPIIPLDPGPQHAPPSVLEVWRFLRSHGATTSADLGRRLGLARRTIRHAFRWLEQHGFSERAPVLGDARRVRARLRRFDSVPVADAPPVEGLA